MKIFTHFFDLSDKYCEGDKTLCARYIVATQLGPEYVTEKLYPNMDSAAKKLLGEHGK